MNDERDDVLKERYRSMSPARKWHVACELRRTAWYLRRAGVKQQHPDWTEEQIEQRVKESFLYGTT
jgi:hypothetical protein